MVPGWDCTCPAGSTPDTSCRRSGLPGPENAQAGTFMHRNGLKWQAQPRPAGLCIPDSGTPGPKNLFVFLFHFGYGSLHSHNDNGQTSEALCRRKDGPPVLQADVPLSPSHAALFHVQSIEGRKHYGYRIPIYQIGRSAVCSLAHAGHARRLRCACGSRCGGNDGGRSSHG